MIECRFCGCVFVFDLDLADHLDVFGRSPHKRDASFRKYSNVEKDGSSFPRCPCYYVDGNPVFVRGSKACDIKIAAGVCRIHKNSDDVFSLLGEVY